jgi:hypothetical protein
VISNEDLLRLRQLRQVSRATVRRFEKEPALTPVQSQEVLRLLAQVSEELSDFKNNDERFDDHYEDDRPSYTLAEAVAVLEQHSYFGFIGFDIGKQGIGYGDLPGTVKTENLVFDFQHPDWLIMPEVHLDEDGKAINTFTETGRDTEYNRFEYNAPTGRYVIPWGSAPERAAGSCMY